MKSKKAVPKDKWVWMPHPAHLCVAQDCRFFLATKVGKYIVSTVGEYLPDVGIREIFAKSRGVKLEGMGDARRADYMKKIGYEDIGFGRKYETIVFPASKPSKSGCKACPYVISSGRDFDMKGYNTAEEAYKGHMALCAKWAKK